MVAILIGIVVITFFIADIINQSKIETLTEEHVVEIEDINSRNENFTDYFLQGSVTIDAAREKREVGNLHFVLAFFWYNNAVINTNVWYNNEWINGTSNLVFRCIENCTDAMSKYITSYENFSDSKPYFELAKSFTERYKKGLDDYIQFAHAGQIVSMLRYNASNYLRQMAENLSLGQFDNVSMLFDLFNETNEMYEEAADEYESLKDWIDYFVFFSEVREEEPPE